MVEEIELSKLILDIIPPTMRVIRSEVRGAAADHLTIPQFRILAHVFHGASDATSLSEIQGVSLPAISKMIESLVQRDLLDRQFSKTDRRKAIISLTVKGREFFLESRKAAQRKLNERLGHLDRAGQKTLRDGLEMIRKVFLPVTPESK